MKKLIIFTMLMVAFIANAQNPIPTNSTTVQEYWHGINGDPASTYTTTADTALTTTTRKWADRDEDDLFIIPERFNNIEVRFRTQATATTGVAQVYAYTDNDDAVHVCDVNMVGGAMTATYGGYYVDTLSLDDDDWTTDIVLSEADAADGMGRVSMDVLGYKYLDVRFTTIGDANGFTADIRGF